MYAMGSEYRRTCTPPIKKRVWLIRAALKLKERARSVRSEASLARAFGGAAAHA